MESTSIHFSEILEDNSKPVFTISVAAKLVDTSISTLRMYEEKGLIIPHKTQSKHRLYSAVDLSRLMCIRRHLDEDGLNIAGIKSLLALVPCWAIKPCSIENRNSCSAYTSTTKPCWEADKKGKECKEENCRDCPVYKLADQCTDIKQLYKKLLQNGEQRI